MSARRVRSEPVAMQDAMRGFLSASGLGTRLQRPAAFAAWDEAVGPGLARRARPVRFAAGELQVEVESAAHLHELSAFTGEGYRQQANERLGEPAIRRVTFRLQRRA